MDIDLEAVDEAVLALFQLTLHEGNRAWKQFDWDVLARLHSRGLIADPIGTTKSVWITAEGLEASQQAFKKLFTR